MSSETPEQELPTLESPAEGVPPVIKTDAELAAAIISLRAGTGPVAIDAERAQGFRYSGRAYLIQLRRTGSGTFLIDPTAFHGLTALGDAISDAEWIIHAATQDLPCLAAEGMLPTTLFDTELAGRLLGDPKVGLGSLIAQECGVHLRKEHSAADWSRRPLPDDWLVYAALDVELLIPLRDVMEKRLESAGKLDWAREDFAMLVAGAGAGAGAEPEQREDPWRRLSGLHSLKTPAQLALARGLYEERDSLARKLDKGPGRIVNDRALVALCALVDAKRGYWPNRADLRTIDGLKHRMAHRYENNWLSVIDTVSTLPSSAFPQKNRTHDGPPTSMKAWEQYYPEAFARWELVRQLQLDLAEQLTMPAENVCSPGQLRQLAWEPDGFTEASISDQLIRCGARLWQANQIAPLIASAWATELTS